MVTRIAAPKPAQTVIQQVKKTTQRTVRKVQKNMTDAVNDALGARGERMTKVDTAWLRMDSASNLMMVVGIWVLRPSITQMALVERLEERLLKYTRFSQRVEEDATGATWVHDEDFDIHRHVVVEKLPRAPKGAHANHQNALQNRVATLTMQPLDRMHPLWQFHLIEDYPGPNGENGSALIVRIHHCIADGIALISVTNSLVDGGRPPPEHKAKAESNSPEDWLTDVVLKPFTELAVKALGRAGDRTVKSLQLLSAPQEGLQTSMASTVDMAKIGFQVASDLAAMALMPDDSKTRLKGKPGTTKRVAWCPPIPLEEVKAVGRALNASVNDVLLSCVAGAIGAYLKSHGDDPKGQEIRAMVPVNLRPIEEAYKLGNRFGLAPLVLPIGVSNPIERVYEVRRRMNEMKSSYQPLLAFSLLAVAGRMGKSSQEAMLNLFGKKTTAVMTNVPGPKTKLKLCGSTIEENMFWVPQSGDVGLGVSILSYGGGVQFGVITDSTLCPDPQGIIDRFEPEFAKLGLVTLMPPWDD